MVLGEQEQCNDDINCTVYKSPESSSRLSPQISFGRTIVFRDCLWLTMYTTLCRYDL